MTGYDWHTIESRLWRGFDVAPTTTESVVRPSRRDRVRQEKRARISAVKEQVKKEIESANRPRTQDELISRILGVTGRILSMFFPQYALIFSVIVFIWNELVEADKTIRIAGVASGSEEGGT
jgi:hypothetical protein